MTKNHQKQTVPNIKSAINKGILESEQEGPNKLQDKISYKLTKSEAEKMTELGQFVRGKTENFPNFAISYVHFMDTTIKKQENRDLIDKWKKRKSEECQNFQEELKATSADIGNSRIKQEKYNKDFLPTPDIDQKLRELEMTEKVNECIFFGIKLMHENFIENALKSFQKAS
ncbi:MAG: hypothetical protein P5702_09040 [Limnospira sp. PMC 1291.21]|uniref:hypothetical protein n=1 Tax=Limnospira TaxID=2596745 RepID=UPI000280422B|nr:MULTISPECIES: hypothetical protein [unclassified Limnospira]EKD06782.1 hypothetical protein SPLC1_S520160 [Arthrospira platensis C1]MDC0839709.1 hypothetical protein [Limnoraphis robusta]MDT9177657.1 hypothetical protein [Limnospira sp. PMC 1238.20]MDT9192974.1 hypothetical protein [Limnospira sp. PMC 1245.20]MDT9203285.1 hypothetical protein [Limnospira sp. PMC 1243.20]